MVFPPRKVISPRAYNEKHIVSSFVWQADRFFEKESGLPGEKLERL